MKTTLAAVLTSTLLALTFSAAPAQGASGALAAVPLRPVVLDEGHIDLFELTYDQAAEQLDLNVKDDTGLYDLGVAYRDPETVTVAVDQALSTLQLEEIPPGYEFLAPAGRPLYILDWSQQPDLPWPGWSTERLVGTLPDGVEIAHEVGKIKLAVDVNGPGDVFIFTLGGGPSGDQPQDRFIDTTDDQPEVIQTLPDSHYHTNWVFTEPGDYELTVAPSATTTTGQTLSGPAKSYHFHVGPRTDVPRKVSAQDFGASISGVPATVGDDTEVNLALQLDQPHPEVAGYQWYRWVDGQGTVKIPGATTDQLNTTVDPWESVSVALLDASGRVLSVAYANFVPVPSAPGAPGNPTAWVEPNGRDVTVSWATPNSGNSPLTGFVATLTSSTGQVLTRNIPDGDAYQTTFTDVPVGTWTGKIHALNAVGTGPDSENTAPVTVAAPPSNVSKPVVSGTPKVGGTLTATSGGWDPMPSAGSFTFQWQSKPTTSGATWGNVPSGGTASTFVPTAAERGKYLRVRVVANGDTSHAAYSSQTATVAYGTFSGAAPTLSSSAPKVGVTLTATPSFSPAPSSTSFQWYRVSSSGTATAISGATASTYKPTATTVGYKLKVAARAAKSGYTSLIRTRTTTSATVKGSLTATVPPAITGTTVTGSTLTASKGTWSATPSSWTYQWYRVGPTGTTTAISGATAATHKLTTSDAGSTLKVKVIVKRTGYNTTSKTSAASAKVLRYTKVVATGARPSSTSVKLTVTVGVAGVTNPRGTVTAKEGGIQVGTTVTLGSSAAGKATISLTGVTAGQHDYTLTYTPTTSNAYKKTSSVTVKDSFATAPTPTINDTTPAVGQMLTAIENLWSPTPSSFRYQWYKVSGTGATSPISGATAKTYKVASTLRHYRLKVKVTAVKTGWTSKAMVSVASSKVP